MKPFILNGSAKMKIYILHYMKMTIKCCYHTKYNTFDSKYVTA